MATTTPARRTPRAPRTTFTDNQLHTVVFALLIVGQLVGGLDYLLINKGLPVPVALVLGTVALFVARLGVERYATHLRRRAAKSRKTTK
jgi:hypothetical protein